MRSLKLGLLQCALILRGRGGGSEGTGSSPASLTTRKLGNLSGKLIEIGKDDMILLFTQRPIGGPAADSGINKPAKLRDAIALDVD